MTYAFAAALPGFPQVQTFAPHPVWKGSFAGEVKFAPLDETPQLSKKKAAQIFRHARRLEKQTAITRVDAFGKRHTQGCIGRCGMAVLYALLFDFLNHRCGRLDPCLATLAAAAGVSLATVKRALARLKAAGVVNWVRRCYATKQDSRFVLEQDSNAYAVLPWSGWRGYRAPPEAGPPDPEAWGAAPPMPAASAQALELLRAGDRRGAVRLYESTADEPAAGLLDAIGRMTRRLQS